MSKDDLTLDQTLTQPLPEVQANFTGSLHNEDESGGNTPQNKDNEGEVFDPNYHSVDANGNPKKTKTGKFRKKTGASRVASGGTVSEEVNDKKASQITAMQFVEINYMLGKQIGGDAGLPKQVLDPATGKVVFDEKAELFEQVRRYCEENDIKDFPPGVTIALLVVPYWFRVSSSYFTKNHGISIWQGISLKVKSLFKGKKNAARTDNRTNTERENNSGNQESTRVS